MKQTNISKRAKVKPQGTHIDKETRIHTHRSYKGTKREIIIYTHNIYKV